MIVLGVMVGGSLGSLARFLTGLWLQPILASGGMANFPLATLSVNVVGSFGLSLLTTLGLQGLVSPAVRIAIGTGFLGAFTTYSTFELEADLLLREGRMVQAFVYIAGNLLLGYLAILLGRGLAMRWGGAA